MGDRGADLRAADLRTADLRTADFRTVDVAALCIKSGNVALLRGSASAQRSNAALAAAVRGGLADAGLPEDVVIGRDIAETGNTSPRPNS